MFPLRIVQFADDPQATMEPGQCVDQSIEILVRRSADVEDDRLTWVEAAAWFRMEAIDERVFDDADLIAGGPCVGNDLALSGL